MKRRRGKGVRYLGTQSELELYFPHTRAATARKQQAESRDTTRDVTEEDAIEEEKEAAPHMRQEPRSEPRLVERQVERSGKGEIDTVKETPYIIQAQEKMEGGSYGNQGERQIKPQEPRGRTPTKPSDIGSTGETEMGILRALIQALPTKADIEAMMSRMEENHRKELNQVHTEIHHLSERLKSKEGLTVSLEARVQRLEQVENTQTPFIIDMQLQLEEFEDRSRRQNLRFRGIPETIGREALQATVLAICLQLHTPIPPQALEFERIHRTMGPPSGNLDRPRDVICRFHRYAHKELISRKAWEVGVIEHEGVKIKILPDLSRATLQRRAMLRPLLDKIKTIGGTYRWGYPISLIIKKNSLTFILRHPGDLPDLFNFLEMENMAIPNWLQVIPGRSRNKEYPGRSKPTASK